MSSSTWSSPDNALVDDIELSDDATPFPSGLEAVQTYDSPSCRYSPNTRMVVNDVNYIKNTADEDEFLYGSSSLLQEEPLKKVNETEPKQSTDLDWSDEEDGNILSSHVPSDFHHDLNAEDAAICNAYDEAEKSDIRADLDESNALHNKPKSDANETPGISSALNENGKLNIKQEKCDPEFETKDEPTKNVPFECHPFLSSLSSDENKNKECNSQSQSEKQKKSDAVKEKSETEITKENVASEGIQKQCNEISSDSKGQNSHLSQAAHTLISEFMGKAKSSSSGCSSQPTSERTFLVKHSKTSSETEKIVLQTSKTITNYSNTPRAFAQKTLDTINKYLKISTNNDTQNERVQQAKRSSHENREDISKPLASKPSDKSLNLQSPHPSAQIGPPIRYKDVGSKHRSLTYSRNPRSRSRPSPRRRSLDRSPRRRSRDRSPRRRSRDRSSRRRSRDRSARRRSRDKRSSYTSSRTRRQSRSLSYDSSPGPRSRERNSKFGSYASNRSRRRSCNRSRYRASRSRSRDKPRRRSRDRSPDRKYRRRARSDSSDERRVRSPRTFSYQSHPRRCRSQSRESSDSSDSSFDSIYLRK